MRTDYENRYTAFSRNDIFAVLTHHNLARRRRSKNECWNHAADIIIFKTRWPISRHLIMAAREGAKGHLISFSSYLRIHVSGFVSPLARTLSDRMRLEDFVIGDGGGKKCRPCAGLRLKCKWRTYLCAIISDRRLSCAFLQCCL